jgi:hypothetical protein
MSTMRVRWRSVSTTSIASITSSSLRGSSGTIAVVAARAGTDVSLIARRS